MHEHNIENRRMSTGWKVFHIVAVILIAAIITTMGVFLVRYYKESKGMTDKLESQYTRTFYDLKDSMYNVEMNLSKLMVSGEGGLSAALSLDAYRSAVSALDCLTRLPIEQHDVMRTAKFLNQLADFSRSYNIAQATKVKSAVNYALLPKLYSAVHKMNIKLAESEKTLKQGVRLINLGFTPQSEKQDGDNIKATEYPEMIYDGPFADSTDKKVCKGLENLGMVSKEQAMQAVTDAGFEIDGQLEFLGETTAEAMPCYDFGSKIKGGGEMYCSVTKQGGKIVSMDIDKATEDSTLTEDEAKEKAVMYAKKMGMDLKPVWYISSDNVATVNLAPIENETVFYTDLVKVKVSLADGSLRGIEGTAYCTNHCKRELSPTLNEKTALSLVGDGIKVDNVRLAVIPLEKGEKLCYELTSNHEGLDFFIYVNAQDGNLEKILRVIDDNQGKMTF